MFAITLNMRTNKWKSTYPNQYVTRKNANISMGKWYPYSMIWVEIIVVIIHVYGAKTILLLFCVHQGTKYVHWEIEICVARSIFNKKKQNLYGKPISTFYKMGGGNCGIYSYLWRYSYFLLICDQQYIEYEKSWI